MQTTPNQSTEKPTILLFGTGQVGAFAARAIENHGAIIRAADVTPDEQFYRRFGPRPTSLPPTKCDVTNKVEVDAFIYSNQRADCAVFAAGFTRARAEAAPAAAKSVAQQGLANVLNAAAINGISRAVVVSSLAVYGNSFVAGRLSEDNPPDPQTEYGKIQLALEATARSFTAALDITILRVAGIYGPNRPGYGSNSSRLVERLISSAAAGGPIAIYGFLDDEDDLIYVKDVAEAINAAASKRSSRSITVNVGLGEVSTLRDIGKAVQEVFPSSQMTVTQPENLRLARRRTPLDCRRLAFELGVRPKFPLLAAVRDYVNETGTPHGE